VWLGGMWIVCWFGFVLVWGWGMEKGCGFVGSCGGGGGGVRIRISSKKGKVHPCTGTEALYRPYGPWGK